MGLSLFSRAQFRAKKYEEKIAVSARAIATWNWEIPQGIAYCLEKITWKYAVNHTDPKTTEGGYGWPKFPLKVTLDPILNAEISPPNTLQPPKVFYGKTPVIVENPSDIPVYLLLTLEGTLVSKLGHEEVLESEILGYSMLDPSHRGMLALTQATAERQMLETSATPSLHAFPGSSPMALPNSAPPSSDERLSMMIGDIIRAKTSIPAGEVESLAEHLIARGWSRESR